MIKLPSQCAICRAWPAEAICEACVAAFGRPVSRCPLCATELNTLVCSACIQQRPDIDACCAALTYCWPWSQLITAFKFYEDVAWARHFALLMQSAPFAEDALQHADVLIPIPLSAQRLSERGFNQSLMLAQQLSRSKTQAQTLRRMLNTTPQSSLKRSERLTNLRGAFAVAPLQAAQLRFKTWRHRAFAQHHGNSAFLRQRQRNGCPNAAGPAGDEDDFVLKLQIHGADVRLFF